VPRLHGYRPPTGEVWPPTFAQQVVELFDDLEAISDASALVPCRHDLPIAVLYREGWRLRHFINRLTKHESRTP